MKFVRKIQYLGRKVIEKCCVSHSFKVYYLLFLYCTHYLAFLAPFFYCINY